jgi:hypothetical protein
MRAGLTSMVVVSALIVSSCCKSKTGGDEGPSKGEPSKEPSKGGPKKGDITITMGGDGGYKVSGANPMKGKPADCAAFKACCTAPRMSLACGLIHSTEQDCTKALKSVRNMMKENGTTPPAGCM